MKSVSQWRRTTLCACISLGCSLGLTHLPAVQAQAPGTSAKMTFEDNQPNWIGFGEGVQVGITRDEGNVKNGTAALQFNYQIARGQLTAMITPITGGLGNMQTLKFWIKADHATPMGIVLQEGQNGGRYVALFTTPENKWQQVELTPADFSLLDDNNSPKDPNNQLDLDQIQFIALGDFGQMVAGVEKGALANIFHVRMGPHVAFLDDFEVSSEPPANMTPSVAGQTVIDNFSHPQFSWLGAGAIHLDRVEKAIDGKTTPGMQMSYNQAPGQIAGVVRRVVPGVLQGAKSLSFTAAAKNATTLALQLEERGGGKYFTTVDIPGSGDPQTITANFSDFKQADDSNDQNGRLDLEQVHQILIVDAVAFNNQADDKDNTLWLANVLAQK